MPDLIMLVPILVTAAIGSMVACGLIVATQRWHGALSLDHLSGKQKVHMIAVPRIGGAGMVLGVACAFAQMRAAPGAPDEVNEGVAALMGASLPVFAIGLVEDLTKRVSVRMRFGFMLAASLLACWALGAVLPRVDLPFVDDLLELRLLAVCVTVLAVAGVTNAVNIIDGCNGLAGSTAIAILAGLGFLGWRCGDALVLELALLGIGAAIGFLLLNYPRGLLFMGDGGAYFLGFWCAEIAVLLVCRHPEVSAWQVLALHAYPVIEVLFSIARRAGKGDPTMPDRLHLHTLLLRRCVSRLLPPDPRRPWARNAAVAALLAPWSAAWTVAVTALGGSGTIAALLLGLHTLAYVALYARLVRGRWRFRPGAIFRRRGRVARTRLA